MTVGNDINTLSSLNVDSNDDGTSDITLSPVINGTVTYTAPVSVIAPGNSASGGNGPVVQNIIKTIATTSIQTASTTTPFATSSPVISTTTPVVFVQLKPVSKAQIKKVIVTIPKVVPVVPQIQTASVISAHSALSIYV